MYLQIVSAWLHSWVLESQANHVLSHLTEATLQDDVMANFQFERLGSY